ncbi:ATP-binding protein [Cohnella fermenti]|uniref:Uncharacterized protein n=1 Tax=Cohnella fermenti TaxID=2565925 RepID=A0A4S4BSB1_9BACL|nr:AAA family ATPase [Cohnella fermenti]THF77106.1 hypothetical protein E6C55_17230 [Cohnella fermenti]
MGEIRREVWEKHLSSFPKEESLLKPFLSGFYVTSGYRRKAYNSELSVYILNPEEFMKEAFGFNHEVLLVYTEYESMEPRTLQAAEQFLTDSPAKGRVETLNYFLISEDDSVHNWLQTYISENEETRIIIAFNANELRKSRGDSFFIRNQLSKQFFTRDLFDYKLPLAKDTYFFGRSNILAEYIDSIKRGENRGLFGLRKTGKTSILYKLERMGNQEQLGLFIYFDCKDPSVRKLRWHQLLENIILKVCERYDFDKSVLKFDEVNISSTFQKVLSELSSGQRIVLIFDEIEYISFNAKLDNHWGEDFIDFWQTMWTTQSRNRKIVSIIAGVNPIVVEQDTINGVQNPLFGIITHRYLTGFNIDEMKEMVRKLGRKMGMSFSLEAMNYIFNRYGGHPLLTRIACSLINNSLNEQAVSRPFDCTENYLIRDEDKRDSDLTFYCRHVVSELKQFYANEYEMLELLAGGHTRDFVELSLHSEFIKHLQSYGLLAYDQHGIPYIPIPVIGRYIALELAIQEGRRTILKVIPKPQREEWLRRRVSTVIKDFRFLEKLIKLNKMVLLFGPNSFPEADQFVNIKICSDERDFIQFINICNRCFVDSIEIYGESLGNKKFFWNEFQQNYSGLFYALRRIKIYRHDHMHIQLNTNVSSLLLEYLNKDLERQKPSDVQDLYFVLQQCVLDGLLTALQIEINKIEINKISKI